MLPPDLKICSQCNSVSVLVHLMAILVLMFSPAGQMESIQAAIQGGNIDAVTANLTQIDVEHARASVPEDEVKVKALIQLHSSFSEVNKAVRDTMGKWCGEAFTGLIQSGKVS